VFNPHIRVTTLMSNDTGLVAISLHLPGRAAVAAIGWYNPPATSNLNAAPPGSNRPRGGRSADILELAAQEYQRLRRKYGIVLITGCFHVRPGTLGDARRTADTSPLGGSRTQEFRSFLSATRTNIVDGGAVSQPSHDVPARCSWHRC